MHVRAIAIATDADVSAPKAARATPSLPEAAFLAAWTCVDGLVDQPVLAPQLVSDVGERGGVRLTAANSKR